MITVDDFNYVMNMRKAWEFRGQGLAPEVALRLAGVNWTPSMGRLRLILTRAEALAVFEENKRICEMSDKKLARERRGRKMKKASLFFQIVLAIVLAVAVAHMWKLI